MSSSDRKARRPYGFPVALVLAALAVVPLFGVAMLSLRDVRTAWATQSEIATLETSAENAILMGEFRAAIFQERNWALAIDGLLELGIPMDLAMGGTGVDFEAGYAAASAKTDALIKRLDQREILDEQTSQDLIGEVATLRSLNVETEVLLVRYNRLQEIVNTEWTANFELLRTLVADLRDARNVSLAIRVVQAADTANVMMTELQADYFASQFDVGQDVDAEFQSMIQHSLTYESAIKDLRTLPLEDWRTTEVVNLIDTDEDIVKFRILVRGAVAQSLAARELSGEVGLAALSVMLSDSVAAFSTAVESSERHVAFLYGARQDLARETLLLHNRSAADANEATLIAALFLVAAIVAVLGAARMLVQPLNRLEQSALAMTSGQSKTIDVASGPSEVQAAARALQEASQNLDLVERQANALARGHLEDACLGATAAGSIGESLQATVRLLADSIKRNERFKGELAHEASHDALTSIPNRSASLTQIDRALARARRSGQTAAVMFIDLDGFKQINDSLGHQAGDRVLQVIASRLSAGVRDGDFVGRLGGDEFVVVAEPVRSLSEAVEMSERLLAELAPIIDIHGQGAVVGASIGVAVSSAYGDPVAAQLLSDADLAVYRAKGLGAGRVEVCNDDLRDRVAKEAALSRALKTALEDGQFVVHYQAVLSPQTGDLHSLEALVRWEHPTSGLLAAESFIDFASQGPLIASLDRMVLDLVLSQQQLWATDPKLGGLPVSVNISPRTLAADNFVQGTLEALAIHGVDPSRLILEVKEDGLFEDLDTFAPRLQQLRAEGVQIAVDNFGTGYTSLAKLRYLPIDILKIDASFVANAVDHEDDRALIQMIIDTGHLLGATILAEGVETAEQAQVMELLGTDEVQGYLFSQPRPASELWEDLHRPANQFRQQSLETIDD